MIAGAASPARTEGRWGPLRAADACRTYETVSFEAVHPSLVPRLSGGRARILDVGSGSGRDAAWLTDKGHEVHAVEPSQAMRLGTMAHHPAGRFRVLGDALPCLAHVPRTFGDAFDVVLCSAVLMHLGLEDARRSVVRMVELVRPGGILHVTVRTPRLGETDVACVSRADLVSWAGREAREIEGAEGVPDAKRGDVTWSWSTLERRRGRS